MSTRFAVETVVPADFELPPDGLNLRWPDPPLVQEKRLLHHKLYAALAYCRANQLNKVVIDSPSARLGIVTSGKSYLDVRQALDDLGIDDASPPNRPAPLQGGHGLAAGGRRRAPLRRRAGRDPGRRGEAPVPRIPAQGRALQLARGRAPARRRQVRRKGEWSLPHGGMAAPRGRRADAGDDRPRHRRAHRHLLHLRARIAARLAFLEAKEPRWAAANRAIARMPHFCSGCPHNTSTRCPKAAARWPASAATTWPPGCRPNRRRPSATWAAKACLGRPGAVHRASSTSSPTSATAPTSTPACWPSARPVAGRRQHHLQDPLQRRRGDDRRPAGRRRPDRAEIARQLAGRRRAQDRRRHRRPPAKYPSPTSPRRADPPPRRARRRSSANCAPARRVGAGLRPDLRRREAPPRKRGKFPDPQRRVFINERCAKAAATAA
jgi:hypothetical protein